MKTKTSIHIYCQHYKINSQTCQNSFNHASYIKEKHRKENQPGKAFASNGIYT